MAGTDALNRRIDRLQAALDPSTIKVVWVDPREAKTLNDASLDQYDTELLVVTWEVGSDEASED